MDQVQTQSLTPLICPSCLSVNSQIICEQCGMMREDQCERCQQPRADHPCEVS